MGRGGGHAFSGTTPADFKLQTRIPECLAVLLLNTPPPSLPPSGVGKTELAKALASYLFNSEEAMVGYASSRRSTAYFNSDMYCKCYVLMYGQLYALQALCPPSVTPPIFSLCRCDWTCRFCRPSCPLSCPPSSPSAGATGHE